MTARSLASLSAAGLVALAGCSYEEVEREIGYQGPARINPWLAAERFAESYGYGVVSTPAWQEPGHDESIWFIPGILVESNFITGRLARWMDDGGHLVVLMENADAATNDWGMFQHAAPPVVSPALRELIENTGMSLDDGDTSASPVITAGYRERTFRIDASPHQRVFPPGHATGNEDEDDAGNGAWKAGAVATARHGLGRLTVVADARIFRNRWIDDEDHAALLAAILGDADNRLSAGFMRGSGLSFWSLLGTHLWPLLVAFGAWLFFWLWRCFSRFGPLEAAEEPNNLRGYDHHLEALGGFHWEIDRAGGLLAPIRARIIERGHHLAAHTGRPESEYREILAARAELSREQIARALEDTKPPRDAASLTHLTADLQKILHSLP